MLWLPMLPWKLGVDLTYGWNLKIINIRTLLEKGGGGVTREGWYLAFVLMTNCKKKDMAVMKQTTNRSPLYTTAWHNRFSMRYDHLRSINQFLFVMLHFLMYDYALRQACFWLCSRTQHTLLCSFRASLSLPLHQLSVCWEEDCLWGQLNETNCSFSILSRTNQHCWAPCSVFLINHTWHGQFIQ